MTEFNFSPEIKRDLFRFADEEVGTRGPEMIHPENYPEKARKKDLRKTERAVEDIDTEIRRKESKREDYLDEAAEAASDRVKRLKTDKAADLAREMDTLEHDCDALFLRRSLIKGIGHVRSKFQGPRVDLELDDVLQDQDHDEVAAELEDFLIDQGLEDDGLRAIMQTLDMELQRDAESRSQNMDSYTEQAMKEVERREAQKTKTGSHADDIGVDDRGATDRHSSATDY